MQKIPHRYQRIVFARLMAFHMSCAMSFVLGELHQGFTPDFLFHRPKTRAIAFLVALPAALLFGPWVTAISQRLVANSDG